jgi:hypothetical protein
MLMNCKRSLKSKRIASESKKSNVMRVATTTTILTIICSIKYCAIVVALLSYLIKFIIKDLFILLHKMLEIIESLLLI